MKRLCLNNCKIGLLVSWLMLPWVPVHADRAVSLYAPHAIGLSAEIGEQRIGEAINDSFINAGWHPQSLGKGEILGSYSDGRHSARLLMRYSARQVSFQYQDSKNMSYRSGTAGAEIFGAYNRWVRDFEEILMYRLQQMAKRQYRDGTVVPVKEVRVQPERSGKRSRVSVEIRPAARPMARAETVMPKSADMKNRDVVGHEISDRQGERKRESVPETESEPPTEVAVAEALPVARAASPDPAKAMKLPAPPTEVKPVSRPATNDLGELKW